MKRNITFGLIAGIIIIVYTSIVSLVFGDFSKMTAKQFQIVETFGYLRYIILLLTVFVSMQTFKKQTNAPITYWQAAKQGILVVLVIAVCVGIMEYVYFIVNPDFYEKYGQLYVEQLKLNGSTAQDINHAEQEMEKYKWMQGPISGGVFYFFETALIGGVGALILGAFFRNKSHSVA